jgi:hypothetical protein
MKNSVLYIVGGVVLVGGVAFLYVSNKNKAKKDSTTPPADSTTPTTNSTTPPADGVGSTVTTTIDPVLGTPIKPVVKTLSNEDMLAIQKLRDVILADMGRKGKYKKQSSRNAVQADINKNIDKLKEFGYALDSQNQLIKIAI